MHKEILKTLGISLCIFIKKSLKYGIDLKSIEKGKEEATKEYQLYYNQQDFGIRLFSIRKKNKMPQEGLTEAMELQW